MATILRVKLPFEKRLAQSLVMYYGAPNVKRRLSRMKAAITSLAIDASLSTATFVAAIIITILAVHVIAVQK